jgi:hypothetical protein
VTIAGEQEGVLRVSPAYCLKQKISLTNKIDCAHWFSTCDYFLAHHSWFDLQAIALCVLKQSEDPKFPLYSELPSPALPGIGGQGAFGSGGLHLMPPTFASHLHFIPSESMSTSPGVNPGAIFGPAMPPMGPHIGMHSRASSSLVGDGFTTLTLILTEDQASVLLEESNRPVVEVEQVGLHKKTGDQRGLLAYLMPCRSLAEHFHAPLRR